MHFLFVVLRKEDAVDIRHEDGDSSVFCAAVVHACVVLAALPPVVKNGIAQLFVPFQCRLLESIDGV